MKVARFKDRGIIPLILNMFFFQCATKEIKLYIYKYTELLEINQKSLKIF